MRILVTTLVDLEKSAHNRLHQFLKYLSKHHDISVISVKDWWKSAQIDIDDAYIRDTLSKIDINYLTNKKMSIILQESISPFLIGRLNDFDIHLNYDPMICGYSIAKSSSRRVYPQFWI